MSHSTYEQPLPSGARGSDGVGVLRRPVRGFRYVARLSRDGGSRSLDHAHRPGAVCDGSAAITGRQVQQGHLSGDDAAATHGADERLWSWSRALGQRRRPHLRAQRPGRGLRCADAGVCGDWPGAGRHDQRERQLGHDESHRPGRCSKVQLARAVVVCARRHQGGSANPSARNGDGPL